MNKFLLLILTISFLLLTNFDVKAIENIKTQKDTRFKMIQLDNTSNFYNSKYDKKSERLQAVPEFFILDSLANAYSYYTNEQQPFMYHPESKKLITIKRGYSEGGEGTPSNPNNTKNNLFLLTSDDMGYNWEKPVIIYNKKDLDLGDARYPSIYPYMYSGELAYAYMAPISTGTGWNGFLQGFYSESYNWLADKVYQFEDESNKLFVYEATSNGIVAYENDESFYMYGVSSPMPPEGQTDLTDQSSLGYIKSVDLSDFDLGIPEQWKSDKFLPIPYQNDDSYKVRYSSLVGIDMTEDGKMYLSAAGMFVAGEVDDRWQPGVSVSEDKGQTWSEFNIFPYSLLKEYATQNGVNPDSTFLHNFCWANAVYKDNAYSFMGFFISVNSQTQVNKYQILELNYENKTWSIRKIADHSGYNYILYNPPDASTAPNNQMYWEFQLSKTVDNSTLIAKWSEFYDVMDTEADTVIKAGAHDVFVATRNVNENEWSKKINVTNTPEYDRITWIPNLVPNDLKDIPLLKTWTVCNPSELNASEYYQVQRNLEVPQYVLMTHFNADPISKVDNNETYNFSINSISPNPANSTIEIVMTIENSDFYNVKIYDVLGNKVADLFEGVQSKGLKSYVVNLDNYNSGTYFCVVTSANGSLSKSFNVVK